MSTASGAGRERAFDLTALDGLRGLAALYVVLHHARIYLWVGLHQYAADGSGVGLGLAYASSLLRFGRCAVLVFFLLSGFVIHLRAARALAAGERVPVRPAGFLRRRARRLMPPLVFALLLTAALDAIGMRVDPAMYASFTHGVRTFALNLAFLQTFAVPSFGSNSPLWSLAYEGAFYLAYPVLLAVRVRAGARVAYGSAFAAGAVGWLATLAVWHPAIAIAPYFAVWAAGAVLAEAFALGKTVRQPALLLAAGASIAIWGETAGRSFGALAPDMGFAAGAALAFAVLVLHPWGQLAGAPLVKFRALGARSYTLYVTHAPILILMAAVYGSHFGGLPRAGWLAVAGAAVAVAFAFVAAPLVELPFASRRAEAEAGRAVRRRLRPAVMRGAAGAAREVDDERLAA